MVVWYLYSVIKCLKFPFRFTNLIHGSTCAQPITCLPTDLKNFLNGMIMNLGILWAGFTFFVKFYRIDGRPVGTTIYPGMQMTSVAIYYVLKAKYWKMVLFIIVFIFIHIVN